MNEYNLMPQDAKEIDDYSQMQDFFVFCSNEESRQVFYNNDRMQSTFDLKIFWINKELGLGYGIMDDYKARKIRWFLFGKSDTWQEFINAFASQFRGDNS